MNRVRTALAVLLLGFVLTGCSLHRPQEITPPVEPPAAYVEQEQASPAPPIERWWEAFADERLDALMAEAFAQNLDLAQAAARLEQAAATTRTTAAARRPFLNVEGQGNRQLQPGFVEDTTSNNYRYSLAAGFELDLWQKLKSRREAARLEEEATREEILALYLRLSAQVADLYYLAVEQRAQLELTERTVASFADTLERVERRYREGLVPALDVYQARQNLAGAKARRPVIEANLATAEHGLAILLGRYPERQAAGSLAVLPPAPEAFPAGRPSELLARRPDLRAALRRVEAADAGIAAAIADRFPSFNLLADYGRLRTDFGIGAITGSFWDVILNLAQPVLDGGRRRAEVERRRAAFRGSLAAYHQAVLTAFQEVEDALARNRATEARITELEQRVEATGASLRLSLDRYIMGLSDYLPVLTAQSLDFDARRQLLEARRQLIADRISLARALGGRWMDEQLQQRLASANTKDPNR